MRYCEHYLSGLTKSWGKGQQPKQRDLAVAVGNHHIPAHLQISSRHGEEIMLHPSFFLCILLLHCI